MREVLAALFQVHGGFRIGGVAVDGFEAAMAACDLSPDIVVLDYFMPRWDGEQAAQFIRSTCPGPKIIAFSAVITEAPEWADEFLVKTDIDELLPLAERLCAPAA